MSQIRTTIFFLTITMIITDGMMAAPTQQAQSDPRRRASIINYGKTLAREASAAVTRNIHSFTSNLRQYASTIPRDSAFKDFILPLHFTSNIGNLAAPYVSSKFVAKPIEKASVAVADWIDRVGATSDTLANFITSTLGIDGGDRKMVRRDIGNSSSLSS